MERTVSELGEFGESAIAACGFATPARPQAEMRVSYFFGGVSVTPGGRSVLINCALAPLYNRTTPSCPPAATTEPSGLTPTASQKSLLPPKLRTLAPLSAFQMRTVWSPLHVTNWLVLPMNSNLVTCLPCP